MIYYARFPYQIMKTPLHSRLQMARHTILTFLLLLPACVWAQGQLLGSAALAKEKTYTSLEEALKEPEKVYKLDLFAKNIGVLPPEIGKFKNLQELDISYNRLHEIPKEIGKLKNLQRLVIQGNIHYNFIKGIPTRNLYEGKYYGRNVEIFPKSDSITLRTLSNYIFELPDEAFKLPNLTILDMSSMPSLDYNIVFPKITTYMPNLKRLYLTDNEITQIPDNIDNLAHLEVLDLYDNQIFRVPRTITLIRSMEVIDLGKNFNMEVGQTLDNLSYCPNLKSLFLYENLLIDLPLSIGKFDKLEELDISNNNTVSIPNEIENLTNLKILKLSKNSIFSLPESLGNLVNLQELYLNYNQISRLPLSLELEKVTNS